MLEGEEGGYAQLVDTKSEPEDSPSEVEELKFLESKVPLIGEEFEAVELSGTRTDSSHSCALSDSTTPLSPDHPLTHISPTPTPTRASFHHRTMPFSEGDELGDEDIKEDEGDECLDADDEGERSDDEGHGSDDEGHGLGDEDHRLDDEGHGLEGEGLGLEEEEAAPEGYPCLDIPHSLPEDDRVYTDIPVYPPVAPVQTPLSPKWSSDSLPVSPSSPVVPSPVASLVATLIATISVGEDQFIKAGAQLELYESILQDHTQRLDALPPTLVADIDRDLRELYTRSGVVRDEIFSQRYKFRSLEREQERTVMMFGALYDDHRLIHDMLVQQAAMQHELKEMRGCGAALEQERGHREP
ncbi:hypothetical protein Tco_0795085 [Tanacetum coccineum]